MESIRRAVIDIGTNSVKLLVADVSGRTVHPLVERGRQTRLGRGFYQTQRLQPEAIVSTTLAVKEFAEEAAGYRVASTRIIATSAVRDALNSEELTSAIARETGLPVEVISGDQEAEWAFLGVATNPLLADHALLILDIGGGSTEFILGRGEGRFYSRSFPLGSVRLLESLQPSDPPTRLEFERCRQWIREFLANEVEPALRPALHQGAWGRVHLVGTGGTATVMATIELGLNDFDRDKIDAMRLSCPRIQQLRDHLWSLPLEERRRLPGLPPPRADVILTGVAIYAGVLEGFGFSELRVSTRGMRFAAVREG